MKSLYSIGTSARSIQNCKQVGGKNARLVRSAESHEDRSEGGSAAEWCPTDLAIEKAMAGLTYRFMARRMSDYCRPDLLYRS